MGNDELIKIRPINIDDYKFVLIWSMDKSFCEANGWEKNRNPEELYQWWYDCVNNVSEDFIRMGIELNERLIGYADLACIEGKTAEIGIAIGDSTFWGKGIGFTSAIGGRGNKNDWYNAMGSVIFYAFSLYSLCFK